MAPTDVSSIPGRVVSHLLGEFCVEGVSLGNRISRRPVGLTISGNVLGGLSAEFLQLTGRDWNGVGNATRSLIRKFAICISYCYIFLWNGNGITCLAGLPYNIIQLE